MDLAFLEKTFLQNTIADYLTAAGIWIGGFAALRLFRKLILMRFRVWVQKTESNFDDFLLQAVERFVFPLLHFGVFYVALSPLIHHPSLKKVFQAAGVVVLTFLTIRLLLTVLSYLVSKVWLKEEGGEQKVRQVRLIMPILNVVLWGLGLIFLLDNLGFEISTIIAGLGIGGVAVALASQTILGDLFSYFSIVFDRPFEIGDFVILDSNYMGTIEYIGIKTTRIRSLGGEQIVVPNSQLTGSRIRNYKRMQERRVVFTVGVTYDTSVEKLERGVQIIREVIQSIPQTRFNRAHFAKFGDFSLNYEVVYHVLSADYNVCMDIQQKINFELKSRFEAEGLKFAFPTQTVYLVKEG